MVEIYKSRPVVQINATTASTGESNTASNLGAGTGVFATKSGVDLQFKSLVAGTGISLSNDSNTITITGTAVTPAWLLGSGGTLTGNNTILGSNTYSLSFSGILGYNFTLANNASITWTAQLNTFSRGHIVLGIGSTATQSWIDIQAGNSGTLSALYLDNNDAGALGYGAGNWFRDAAGVGLQYVADYSASYTTRSLVDKGYADKKWSLISGGTLTGNNVIDLTGSYSVDFKNGATSLTKIDQTRVTFGTPNVTSANSRFQIKGNTSATGTNSMVYWEDSAGYGVFSFLDNGSVLINSTTINPTYKLVSGSGITGKLQILDSGFGGTTFGSETNNPIGFLVNNAVKATITSTPTFTIKGSIDFSFGVGSFPGSNACDIFPSNGGSGISIRVLGNNGSWGIAYFYDTQGFIMERFSGTSVASSTATQYGSNGIHFKSTLWTGAAATSGWFSWRSEASTVINQAQTLKLYSSTGASPTYTTPIIEIDPSVGIGFRRGAAFFIGTYDAQTLQIGSNGSQMIQCTSTGNVDLVGTGTFNIQMISVLTEPVLTTGSPTAFKVVGGAHTTLTSAEAIDIDYALNRTVQFSTGSLTTQRAVVYRNPTYAFVGASTLTDAVTVNITGAPVPGTNATFTNVHGLRIDSVNVTGSTTSSYGLTVNAMTGGSVNFAAQFIGGLGVKLVDVNLVLGTATGTMIGSATNQKLGFWAATPIIQPTTGVGSATFTANAGTAVNDASTFDGYTLKQVVKALRTMGLLA